jgi:uncharacterized glyoxalase superfamily metalloenzyme YdcJ
MREQDPALPARDFTAYDAAYAKPFAPFLKTLPALLAQGLVFGRYAATPKGRAARGGVTSTDLAELLRQGLLQVEGLRYEDFLPVSAAGIFASNLNQYGTQSTAAVRPSYSQSQLEAILGKPIIDATVVYRGIEAASVRAALQELGVLDALPTGRRQELENAVAACPAGMLDHAGTLVNT